MQQYDYWDNKKIEAGEDMLEKFNEALGAACVAIFLVSSDSLNPQFMLRDDVKNFIARRKEGLRVIPLIVRDCGWEQVDWLARLNPLPKDRIALRKKRPGERETELKKIVTEVAQIVKRLSGQAPLTGVQPPGELQDRARQEPPPKLTGTESRTDLESLRQQLAAVAKDRPDLARTLWEVGSKYMDQPQKTASAKDYQEHLTSPVVSELPKTSKDKDDGKKTE